MIRRKRHERPEPTAEELPREKARRDAKARRPKRWHERTSVTLTVAAGLVVLALGFVHVITGVESPHDLPIDIALKASFGYRETFINAVTIKTLPYTAAKIKFPLSCRVLQARGYLPSGHGFEARVMVGQMQNVARWQADFERSVGRSERPWEERFQAGTTPGQPDPESAHAANLQGIASAKDGDYQAALAAFSRAVRKAPTFAEAFHNRALVYIAIGNLGQGAADFGRVVEIRPGFVEGHLEQGRLHIQANQYDEAIDVFSRAIAVDNARSEAYLGRALACYVKGQYDQAWRDVRRLEARNTPAPAGFVIALSHASGRGPGT